MVLFCSAVYGLLARATGVGEQLMKKRTLYLIGAIVNTITNTQWVDINSEEGSLLDLRPFEMLASYGCC